MDGHNCFKAAGVVVLLASQFLYQAYAIELCEPRDYYNLANSSRCSIKDHKKSDKSGFQGAMFEIMKKYPFEGKDEFAELLQRKIKIVDSSIMQQQGKKQTRKVQANIAKLEHAKQVLLVQLERVNSATRDNWEGVRNQARNALKETTRDLRDIK